MFSAAQPALPPTSIEIQTPQYSMDYMNAPPAKRAKRKKVSWPTDDGLTEVCAMKHVFGVLRIVTYRNE